MVWLLFLLLMQYFGVTLPSKTPLLALVKPKEPQLQPSSDDESQPIADPDPALAYIKLRKCKNFNLPQIFGQNIYALVRPKVKPTTPEERASAEFQENALQRLVRCRLNNSLCFRLDPPKPRIDFGKFSWTSQRFEPLRAGISQISCKMPAREADHDVHGFWYGVLNANGTDIELQMSVSNYFLSEAAMVLSGPTPVTWYDILNAPFGSIKGLFMMMQKGPDPLDPAHPLNPLYPYSPLNPFFNADADSDMSPFNEDSPFYPSNPTSPFSVLNPGNPFNVFSPVMLLPPSDPMSPFNPNSPYYPTSPLSPYNPDNPNSPLSPGSLLPMPAPSSPFSPLNDGFLMHPLNPYFPGGELAALAVLSEDDPNSPMNPVSPFYPMTAMNPQSPLNGLLLDSPLNPLNLVAHPFNLINGEEIPRSLTEPAPMLIRYDIPGMPGSMSGYYGSQALQPQGFNPVLGPFMADGPHPPPRPNFVRTVGRWFYRSKPVEQTIASVNPCDPRSPFFAGHEYSPYYPFHPSNPYSILNPLNGLPASDPRSPYNPASPVFAGNPESPYHPQHPMNPFNPQSFLWTCQQSGSLHPMNPRSPFYPLNPRSPFSPLNPASPYNTNHTLLSGLDPTHALNPALRTSPFHASNPASPYNPENFNKLNPSYPLNPLHHLFTSVTSTENPTVSLGWNKGVKEDWSLVADTRAQEAKAQADEQLIPYKAPEPSAMNCGPAPPAPPPPQAPYYPGYYMWDPSWPAPKYIKTSEVPVNDPIDPNNWLQIWQKLWELKCKREAALKQPPQPFGPDYAVMDIPKPQ